MAQLTPIAIPLRDATSETFLERWLRYFEFGVIAGFGFMLAMTLVSIAMWLIAFFLIVLLGLGAASL